MNVAWGATLKPDKQVMPEAIRAAGALAIQQQFAHQYRRFELLPDERSRSEWPTGYDRLTVAPLRTATLTSRMCVTVQAWKGPILVGTGPACFGVVAMSAVLAAKYDIARGAAVRESDYEQIEVDMLRNRGAFREVSDDLAGRRLRVSLKKGQVLMRSSLESMPQVAKNQEISLRVVSGNISVETRAVALVDGEQGRVIPVRLLANNERLNATVEASGLAIVRIR